MAHPLWDYVAMVNFYSCSYTVSVADVPTAAHRYSSNPALTNTNPHPKDQAASWVAHLCLWFFSTVIGISALSLLSAPAYAQAIDSTRQGSTYQGSTYQVPTPQASTPKSPTRQAPTLQAPTPQAPTPPDSTSIKFKDVSRAARIVLKADEDDQSRLVQGKYPRVQAWGDFNQDGWVDLYMTSPSGRGKLFANKRNGTFTLAAESAQLQLSPRGGTSRGGTSQTGISQADISLNRNPTHHVQQGAMWVDYNNDSWLDLYVLVDGQNVLFESLPGRGFAEVGRQAGIADSGIGSAATWGDFDQNGYLDLYIANGFCRSEKCEPTSQNRLQDKLFLSNGYGDRGRVTFQDVSFLLDNAALIGAGIKASFTDTDADGDLDILVINDTGEIVDESLAGPASGAILWRNDGEGCKLWCWTRDNTVTPTSVSDAEGIFNLNNKFDLNNDNLEDMNPEEWGINITDNPIFALADYDQDGWLDIAVGYEEGRHRLFHNIGSDRLQNGGLSLRLIGDGSRVSRDAVGAKVTVTTTDDVVLTRSLNIESYQGSSSASTLHFGLGAAKVKSLFIRWPDGKETRLRENMLTYQTTQFTWQIYYPVNVIDQIGGDVISAERGER